MQTLYTPTPTDCASYIDGSVIHLSPNLSDYNFKYIFLNENVGISVRISLKQEPNWQ